MFGRSERPLRFRAAGRTLIPALTILSISIVPLELTALQATQGDRPSRVLTLAEALEIARENHPGIEIATGHLIAARGSAREEGAFPNPVAEWQVEGLSSSGALETDRFLTASLPLDLSGARFARRSSGHAAVRGAEAESMALIREVEFNAASAYWNAALAQALLDAEITQREALQGIAEYDAIRLREGAISEADALRTRLEADRARIAEARARTELAYARADLARALGTSVGQIPRLEPLIGEAMKAAGQTPLLEEALERALAERPELQAATAALEAARLRRSAARRATFPEVGLMGGMKTTNGATGAVLGVSLPVPLFDRNRGAREIATGELRIAEARLHETETSITAEVTAAIEALDALLSALAPEDRDLGARGREVAEIIETAYREGGATLVELLEARRAAADAEISALQWHADLRIALIELNRVTGAPLLENSP